MRRNGRFGVASPRVGFRRFAGATQGAQQPFNSDLNVSAPEQAAAQQIEQQVTNNLSQANLQNAATLANGNIVLGAETPNGTDVTTVVIPETQTTVTVQAAAPAPAPVADECTFPVQSVVLQRQVNITNTAPQVVNAEEDICGNMISYTEQMTRTMTAGAWLPVSGANGLLGNFTEGPNGLTDQEGVVLANSPGVRALSNGMQPTVIQGPYPTTTPGVTIPRVGRRVGSNQNRNAGAMARSMYSFRSA